MTSRTRSTRSMWPAHLAVWLYAAVLCIPLYFVLVSSVKDDTAIFANGFSLPGSWHWDNFSKAWDQAQLGPAMLNSLFITLGAEVGGLALAIPAAYALARSGSRLAAWAEKAFSLGFLIPGLAALVPTVLLAIELQLFQTRLFLILLFTANAQPLAVILLTQFMRGIPRELDEAAVVDGASRLRVLFHIYLPLAMPGVATVFILNFLGIWNEYLFSATLLSSDVSVRTLQVALPTLQSQTNPQYGVLLAGTLLCSVPMFALFAGLQRRMMTALTQGSLKA
ncbi:carbohydrate ABC transporter permease [Streptacidiphilus sp. ASG 303]|uniref:carbohydrate ABC transporter permease n=1 Tax=Streptacidiphilus sp. ASG 303 TaxID=2896847 RepID=UPI001E601595|nr:carbohydrate ABC transporter permease [Streptacidiphilus sp. ASG 303]MCD0483577.1 carbohydrate ABC transporter permease [Streptacidiphilus sp. ASG 303]